VLVDRFGLGLLSSSILSWLVPLDIILFSGFIVLKDITLWI